ncbi:MAG: response regulator [Candidatus Thermoplasmatota archaeon]
MERKIMVVDDEKDVLSSLKTILERENYEVLTVDNGIDCLNRVEEGFEGIILMDLMMPRMDGWETIKEIVERGYTENVSILIITGKGTRNSQNMSVLGTYIHDYQTKPLDIKQLVESIERCYQDFEKKKTFA